MAGSDFSDFLLPDYLPTCTLCNYQFTTTSSLAVHLDKFHDRMVFYQCSICTKELSRRDIYTRHFKQVHGLPKPPIPVVTHKQRPKLHKEEIFTKNTTPNSGRKMIVLNNEPLDQFIRKKNKYVFKPTNRKTLVAPKVKETPVKPPQAADMTESTLEEVMIKKNAVILEISSMINEIKKMEKKLTKEDSTIPVKPETPEKKPQVTTLSTPKKRKFETTPPPTEPVAATSNEQ